MDTGNRKKCIIAFITHKEELEGLEEKAFIQCLKIFSPKRDIKLLLPEHISKDYYNGFQEKYLFEIIELDDIWFKDYQQYNSMCTKEWFYKLFEGYEYMMIYHTDSWVYEDRLDEFIELGYDWYGAPWPHIGNNVGNGGFCLRKISKMIEFVKKHDFEETKYHPIYQYEDIWFILKYKGEIISCDFSNACNFSIEQPPSSFYLQQIKTYPMGFHGHAMEKFWDEDGTKFLEYKKAHLQ